VPLIGIKRKLTSGSSMKKTACTILFLLFMTQFQGQVEYDGSYVHRDGKQIVNGQGNPIVLEGVNLGSWLLWEGWIWGGELTQQKVIFNKIQSKLGNTQAVNFQDSVYSNYITRTDIKKISEECYNVVRVPVNHSLLENDSNPYIYKPEGWAVLDSLLGWCEDYNVYVVLDLHAAPGGQSDAFTSDPDPVNLWESTTNQNRTVLLWKAIADRYKNRGIIAGYDLLNEPIPPSNSALLTLYNNIIDSIRKVDNHHMIFLEGTAFATDFSLFTSLPDPNTTFEFHFYTWVVNNIPAALSIATSLSNNMNVPVWCGEWGENTYTQLDSTMQVLRNSAYGISGNAFWTWKKEPVSNPFFMGITPSFEWVKTIQWIGDSTASEPTISEMQQGIAEFIQAMKVQNCTLNTTLDSIVNYCHHPIIVPKLDENTGVEIVPNPNNGNFSLILNPANPETITIKMLNLLGEEFYKMDKVITGKSNSISINIPDLKPGMYLLYVESAKGVIVKRIIVD
jgi:endoglucanase